METVGLPGCSVVKNLPANAGNARDTGLTPGLRRSPGVENGNPLQYSCLENSIDRWAWQATGCWVKKGSDMTGAAKPHAPHTCEASDKISGYSFVGPLMTSRRAQGVLILWVAALRTIKKELLTVQDQRTPKSPLGEKEKTPNQALKNPKRRWMPCRSLISTTMQVRFGSSVSVCLSVVCLSICYI